MKKVLLLFIVLLSLPIAAQDAFRKGKAFADIQTGITNGGFIFGSKVHYAVASSLSVGAGFYAQSFDFKDKYITSYLPKLTVDYHSGKLQTTDWYTGFSAGYLIWGSNTPEGGGCDTSYTYFMLRDNNQGNTIAYNTHIGFRAFALKAIALNAEIVLGNVFGVKIGISMKL